RNGLSHAPDDPVFYQSASERHVSVLPDNADQEAGRGTHVDVVVEPRTVDEGAGLHRHPPPHHGVLPQGRPGLDPAVRSDEGRSLDVRVRVDLSSLAQPDAVAELEAGTPPA